MNLNLLTSRGNYTGGKADLNLLTSSDSLPKLAEAFLLCCRVDRDLSQVTIANYRYHLNSFIRFCGDSGGIKAITVRHIRLFLLKLRERNSPISTSDYFKSLRRFFNWMVEEEIIVSSPVAKIRLGRLPKHLIQPFTQQDIAALLLLCSGKHFLELRNRAAILIFLDTGLRLSEMAAINICDVDFNAEPIRVMGKGAKERIVRIGKTAQRALLRYLLTRHDELPCLWVTEERRPLTRGGLQTAVEKLCKRAGITGAKPGPHTFRHTAATLALRNGANPFDVQSILGHETLYMTRKYTETVNSEDAVKAHRKFSPVDNMGLK